MVVYYGYQLTWLCLPWLPNIKFVFAMVTNEHDCDYHGYQLAKLRLPMNMAIFTRIVTNEHGYVYHGYQKQLLQIRTVMLNTIDCNQ